MTQSKLRGSFLALLALALAGCTTTPGTPEARGHLTEQTQDTIAAFNQPGATLGRFFQTSYAYAVFPDVTIGAFGVGGAYGKGELFERGKMIGYCDVSQASIGAQIGGQSFSEVIFFDSKGATDRFKDGRTAFDAAASAIAADSGSAAKPDYEKGVAVFTMARGGLMIQAAIGGQHFSFDPK